jgi:flagellar biogenesis protein FliO
MIGLGGNMENTVLIGEAAQAYVTLQWTKFLVDAVLIAGMVGFAVWILAKLRRKAIEHGEW